MEKTLVFVDNGRPVTDSLTAAEVFRKEHRNVMRDLQKIITEVDKEFSLLNFEQSNYRNKRGREYDKYLMTEDEFTILVMGYTDKMER